MWVRGLKLRSLNVNVLNKQSHPMWVRGLKLCERQNYRCPDWSHPMWVRGLKLNYLNNTLYNPDVAPYVGAWIETP